MHDTLNDLEAKAKAATPGPRYETDDYQNHDHEIRIDRTFEPPSYIVCNIPQDARFIAACSPDVILQLITALREAEKNAIEHVSGCFDMRCRDCRTYRDWLAKYGAKTKGEKE